MNMAHIIIYNTVIGFSCAYAFTDILHWRFRLPRRTAMLISFLLATAISVSHGYV